MTTNVVLTNLCTQENLYHFVSSLQKNKSSKVTTGPRFENIKLMLFLEHLKSLMLRNVIATHLRQKCVVNAWWGLVKILISINYLHFYQYLLKEKKIQNEKRLMQSELNQD